ncbi:MAG: 50S ribosomal protein L10 [Acidimicrobiaceae bacterium]|nr:50S ribosomal protein L10 [Acidimicrobiia bacterium]MCY4493521.1 50S ribosomal protein L10 [Acidimicrobiaceae bacterium]
MKNPNPAKVAVVDELKEKFADTDGMILTEYRGLDVAAMAELRHALRQAGGEYKIYKNTLVRLAARDAGLEIEDLLVGPTALAFVGERPDGSDGDVAAVAKAIREFAKSNQLLVVKGGVLGDKPLDSDEIKALAELPSREILLAQLAGAFQAPMASFARLLSAVPRHFAYALNALIEKRGGPDAVAETPAETPAEGEPRSDQSEPDTTAAAPTAAAPTDDGDATGDASTAATAAAPTAAAAAESDDASNPTEASADADAGQAGESGEASQEKEA